MAGAGSQNRQALASIQTAFETFQRTVTKDDARQFQSTELKDVWAAAKIVENRLAAKQQSRNLRKIRPFLDGLEHYSKAVEVLCNGTPFLPWIWVSRGIQSSHQQYTKSVLGSYQAMSHGSSLTLASIAPG